MPTPRSAVASHARQGLEAARLATETLRELVGVMDDAAVRGPSALPGWTRGHVITHLARNADALLNRVIWARTGVEHPMYASAADRDADIAEGAQRMRQIQQEDLGAACDRFFYAAERLPDSAWSAQLGQTRSGSDRTAEDVPWMRLVEVLVHMVDLDSGIGFDRAVDLAGEHIGGVFDQVLRGYTGRPDLPATRLDITLPSGENRSWTFGSPDGGTDGATDYVVSGPADAALAWLTGRSAGENLAGEVPTLPRWL